ncbi:MAG: phosphate regulon sensor histidine kinase PhoR [Burkholderiaceae bacterium]|nr:phosphate regulon sensor histidine kinase PhoR [Burkholderiaceae bacterium]
MNLFLRNLAVIVLVVAIGAGLALYVSEPFALWWFGIVFVTYAIMQSLFLARLYHWSSLPRNRSLPAGIGPWRQVVTRLARFARQEADTRSELGSELERIHAAVDRLPDGLVVLDRYDHVLWANDAAESLHGIFGTRRPIHHFIRQPEFARFLEANEADSAIRLQLPRQPGRTYELRLHRAQGDQKLLITRDVTNQAKLDAMRSDFVANVSHEIRTPITVIAGFAETLLTLELDESARREYLGSILKQSQTMQRLVDDLLMLSSLESSADELAPEPVDLHRLLEALLVEARALSRERHQFALELDGPRRVLAAPGELESAVRNLLTNAIRYTPDGGRISISWRVRDGEGRISVRDTGIGIPAEHIPRITERFYRVDRGRSRASGGTGLGLAIVKRIMHRHQGRLEFESAPGRGSTFTLCLPTARLLGDTDPPRHAAGSGSAPAEPASSASSGTAEAPCASGACAGGAQDAGAPPPSAGLA